MDSKPLAVYVKSYEITSTTAKIIALPTAAPEPISNIRRGRLPSSVVRICDLRTLRLQRQEAAAKRQREINTIEVCLDAIEAHYTRHRQQLNALRQSTY